MTLGIETGTEDLVLGLREVPPRIPSKFFYDERGSQLFDAICDLPEYYPTRTEQALLEDVASQIAEITRARQLIELGSGTARKTGTLIGALLGRDGGRVSYVPLDISAFALEQAAAAIAEDYPEVVVKGIACDYTLNLDGLEAEPGCLAAFLGSTIGNFTHARGVALLKRLQQRLQPGAFFLLGVDLVKPIEILEAAYNDEAGLTERFNKNILEVVNRSVGADFDPDGFAHLAFFDEEASQIEMHLVALSKQKVRLRDLGFELDLEPGERIHTEISRKFTHASVGELLADAGFRLRRFFPSAENYFALALADVAG